jgi:hypothetical protein
MLSLTHSKPALPITLGGANILRSKNLNLKYNTASLLKPESGSKDPPAYTRPWFFRSFWTLRYLCC